MFYKTAGYKSRLVSKDPRFIHNHYILAYVSLVPRPVRGTRLTLRSCVLSDCHAAEFQATPPAIISPSRLSGARNEQEVQKTNLKYHLLHFTLEACSPVTKKCVYYAVQITGVSHQQEIFKLCALVPLMCQ